MNRNMLKIITLLFASLAALHAAESVSTDKLPAFSWERVPRYMHIRKDTAFTADEIRYLASFPLVTFEKMTGNKDFGSTEEGTLEAARAVKALNPATKILYYQNVFIQYGGYAANAALENVPEVFLAGSNDNQKLVRGKVQAYDLTNANLRDWWLSSAKQVCADPAIDGLFFDGNIKVLEPNYLRNEIGETKKAGVVEGYTAMMKDARRILGPEKLMLANVLRARFPDSGMSRLSAFDGSYIEAFETTVGQMPVKDYVAKGIEAFQKAARQGYLIAFTAGLGEDVSDEEVMNPQGTDEIRKSSSDEKVTTRRFNYLLAMFLICAEKHSYFFAHDGYDAKKSKVWMSNPPEFERPLGAPMGPAVQDGYIYTRDFAHASVRLDIENQIGSVDWKDSEGVVQK
ncbi:MAG: hypothetical protein EBY32_15420 [Proteobacteria bacterium]|nr:hypothetical protein [Pseudomonadota bacterium]